MFISRFCSPFRSPATVAGALLLAMILAVFLGLSGDSAAPDALSASTQGDVCEGVPYRFTELFDPGTRYQGDWACTDFGADLLTDLGVGANWDGNIPDGTSVSGGAAYGPHTSRLPADPWGGCAPACIYSECVRCAWSCPPCTVERERCEEDDDGNESCTTVTVCQRGDQSAELDRPLEHHCACSTYSECGQSVWCSQWDWHVWPEPQADHFVDWADGMLVSMRASRLHPTTTPRAFSAEGSIAYWTFRDHAGHLAQVADRVGAVLPSVTMIRPAEGIDPAAWPWTVGEYVDYPGDGLGPIAKIEGPGAAWMECDLADYVSGEQAGAPTPVATFTPEPTRVSQVWQQRSESVTRNWRLTGPSSLGAGKYVQDSHDRTDDRTGPFRRVDIVPVHDVVSNEGYFEVRMVLRDEDLEHYEQLVKDPDHVINRLRFSIDVLESSCGNRDAGGSRFCSGDAVEVKHGSPGSGRAWHDTSHMRLMNVAGMPGEKGGAVAMATRIGVRDLQLWYGWLRFTVVASGKGQTEVDLDWGPRYRGVREWTDFADGGIYGSDAVARAGLDLYVDRFISDAYFGGGYEPPLQGTPGAASRTCRQRPGGIYECDPAPLPPTPEGVAGVEYVYEYRLVWELPLGVDAEGFNCERRPLGADAAEWTDWHIRVDVAGRALNLGGGGALEVPCDPGGSVQLSPAYDGISRSRVDRLWGNWYQMTLYFDEGGPGLPEGREIRLSILRKDPECELDFQVRGSFVLPRSYSGGYAWETDWSSGRPFIASERPVFLPAEDDGIPLSSGGGACWEPLYLGNTGADAGCGASCGECKGASGAVSDAYGQCRSGSYR